MQTSKLLAGSFLTAVFLFPAFCPAQTISIVSGNGQLVCPACAGGPYKYAPLEVQVNDATGKPVVNQTVTWVATQQGFQPVTAASATDSTGVASYTFTGTSPFGLSLLPATVVASALNTSVQFVETTAAPGGGGAPAAVATLATTLAALTGSVGQTAATPFKVSVFGLEFAGPVPGVSVMLETGSSTGPSVSCATQPGQQPGMVLTDSTGTATCYPVFGGTIGTGTYKIAIGGIFATFGPEGLTVTAGPPALIKIISGNNQNVNPGAIAPLALVAEVTDLGGNPSNEAAVTWSVTEGSATLTNPGTTTNINGDTSAFVTATSGPVQVTVALANNSAVKAVFTVNVNVTITALQIVAGNNQPAAKEGAAFADPLIVQVNDNSTPVPGVTVNFAVTSGPATIGATSAVTNAQGQAQVTATAGATPGAVVITASVKSGNTSFSQAFDLNVSPQGPIISAITNAASFQVMSVSPCSLATIFGTGMVDDLQGVAMAFIEPQTQVAGVSVAINGVNAPILDVANVNGQQSVSFQMPCETPVSTTVPPATVPMVVTAGGAASAPFAVTVSPLSPGIFQFLDTDGATRAVLIRPDGSFVSVTNPARRGDIIRMFVTGLGQTSPPLVTNEFDPLVPDANNILVPQVLPVTANLLVGVNNGGVLIVSASYAYGMVGVYEVDFQVPENTATGSSAPFDIIVYQNVNQLFYGNGSLIPIE